IALKAEKKIFRIIKKKVIQREDGKDYMVRYSLPTFNWLPFSLKIHKILLSDDFCLHDDPWLFYSLILKGGYWEHTPPVDQHKNDITSSYNGIDSVNKWIGPGSFIKRPAHWIHRLEIPENKPCWTFVITMNKSREWGFFTKKFGFLNWKNYNSEEHCE